MIFPFTLIDLSHELTPHIPAWDTLSHFKLSTTLDYAECTTDVKFRVQHINGPAGIGTHMDSPSHCAPGGTTIEKLALEQLLAPCVVIDVSDAVSAFALDGASADALTKGETMLNTIDRADETYVVSVEDIEKFERNYGMITPKSFVIIRTGWDKLWNEPTRYRNNLVFPSVTVEAARMLLERNIVGLGIDTLSPDQSYVKTSDDTDHKSFPVHQLLLGAGKYIVENVAHADKLPPVGSWCLIAPLKIAGGTEAPVRLIGLVKRP